MRLGINLASQPYSDTRKFYARWNLALVLTGIATALLIAYAVYTWVDGRSVARDIRRLTQQQAQLDEQRRHTEEILNRPENRGVRDTSQLVNNLIARKALFSWTLVLSELEQLMPPRVRVLSIKPDIDKNNQMVLDLSVEGESYDNANDLVKRMEQSRRFRNTRIVTQSSNPSSQATPGGLPSFKFEISAIYLPAAPPATVPAPAQAAGQAGDK